MSLNPLNYGPQLRQPDQRSCGPSCLVVARMRLESAYAADALPRFGSEVLNTHRRVVGFRPAMGALQLPWPRALGTPPWAVAHEMSRITGTTYSWRLGRWRRKAAYDRIVTGLGTDLPVPVFVGNRRLPRHVVLATEKTEAGAIEFYNPANGRLSTVPQDAIVTATMGLGSWDVPWFTVTPRS
jgi:hypothetical protein